ncbi:MAG TPA: methyl-accepting chemotaxis protein [Desulfobacteraceae bacterium]|nr:methyl-accepting chemotaxis protein [Desulfobacteraceae bacterium]
MDHRIDGGELMKRTSIKNKMILSFLLLLLIVMVVVGVTNQITGEFYTAIAISAALALLAGILFGSIFSRSLLRRLHSLSKVAQEVSRGDLSKDIPLLSVDEVRDLEEVFATMVKQLRGMISEMKTVAGQIETTNNNLSELTGKVLSNSRVIAKSGNAIAGSSEKQSVIVQETSIALHKGLENMDDMSERSRKTVSAIDDARRKAEQGEANARDTLRHLDNVLKQMMEYAKPIYRLSGKVEKIRIVMGVLDEVSQKTDLLSLNASIEATRAGEMGKGFALVADEIRSMAENSRQSSQQIGRILEDIFEDNKAVMDSLKNSEAGISRGREIISGIVETFGEVLLGVQNISADVREVEKVTRKQVKEMRGFLTRFKELAQLSQDNFINTQKTTIGTKNQEEDIQKIYNVMQSLSSLSKKMMETQQKFRIKE